MVVERKALAWQFFGPDQATRAEAQVQNVASGARLPKVPNIGLGAVKPILQQRAVQFHNARVIDDQPRRTLIKYLHQARERLCPSGVKARELGAGGEGAVADIQRDFAR